MDWAGKIKLRNLNFQHNLQTFWHYNKVSRLGLGTSPNKDNAKIRLG